MLQGYIRYFRVMLCEKIPVETLCILDPFYGGSGSTLRLADPRRRKALRGGHRAAASLASRHRLSHCLGHFVRTYGDRRSPDLSLPPIRCPLPKPAALFGTAGLQLLLEPSVLQPAALWPSLCLDPETGFSWIGEYDITADELLSGAGGNTATKTEQAERLILDLLADGKELASEDIDKAAAEAGISARTVRAAKKNLDGRITSKRIGAAWYHALKK